MTSRPYGTITLRCRLLFQSYSRRLLLLFFLRSLRRQWKAVRRFVSGKMHCLLGALGGMWTVHDSPELTRRSARSKSKSGVGGYESIIPWPIERKKDLIAPIPPRSSPFAPASSQPLVIRFVGSYWYFQPPEKHPGPNAHEAHGSPAAMAIRSENSIALAVEAHQSLPYSIEISRCREIEVDVDLRDSEPGEVAMAVLLSDARFPKRPAMSLGRQLVISNDPGHPNFRFSPSLKSLRFPIPEHTSIRRFNEITLELIPDLNTRL